MSQSLVKQYIHLVFSTKRREDTLPKQHLSEIHSYVAGVLNDKQCPAISVGGTTNHIHILYEQNRTMSVSETVRTVKANSSKWINENFNKFAWQNGYGAFSISRGHIGAVVNYINNQEFHHKQVAYEDEFKRTCVRCGAEYDERYVWD